MLSRRRRGRTTSSPTSGRSPGPPPPPADLAFLAGLLTGSAVAGRAGRRHRPAVDRCCGRLVSRGPAVRRRSTVELTRDATDTGERQAATCRAAVPSPTVKRETWETLTDGKLTIAMFRATLAGFADPDQRALIEPYRPAYFARSRRRVAGLVLGDGAGLRGRRLPDAARSDAETVAAPTRTWRPRRARRPRCAGCSSRAATRCCGRCAARNGTAPPYGARHQTRPESRAP